MGFVPGAAHTMPCVNCDSYMVRYADDFVCCFQYKSEAKSFYRLLTERLAKFNLNIALDKSKIIEFGEFAPRNVRRRGENKPDTFDFLGFTHYCGQSQNGRFRLKRKTSRKKYKSALYRMKPEFP
jgi:RNA-directed DNA polymerase